jgi:hypothetical protein
MKSTERTSWLELLSPTQKFEVVAWSVFAKKRYYIFEHWWNIGKASMICYRDAKKLSFREVRKEYKQIKESKK